MGNESENRELAPRVAVVSDGNDLLPSFVFELLERNFLLDVYARKNHINKYFPPASASAIRFSETGKKLSENYDYVVCLNLFQRSWVLDEEEFKKNLTLSVSLARANKAKIIFCFPFLQERSFSKSIAPYIERIKSDEALFPAVVYIGQLVGFGMGLEKKDLFAQILRHYLKNETAYIPYRQDTLYLADIQKTTDALIKTLFSLGAYGGESAIFSEFKTKDLLEFLKRRNAAFKYKYTDYLFDFVESEFKEKIFVDLDPYSCAEHILEKNEQETKALVSQKRGHSEKKRKATHSFERSLSAPLVFVGKALRGILAMVIVPGLYLVYLVFLSGGLTYLAKNFLGWGNLEYATTLFSASFQTSLSLKSYLTLVQRVDSGFISKRMLVASDLFLSVSDLGVRSANLLKEVLTLPEKVKEGNSDDLSERSRKISLELDYLYKLSGFLYAGIDSISGAQKTLLLKFVGTQITPELRRKLLLAKGIAKKLPTLLGEEAKKTYLLVFQDESVVRPTGGIVNDLALVTVESGRLVGVEIFSSKETDKFLKGQVDAPLPLAKHASKERWYFQDFNWDPDFAQSAKRAEWFLDKELDRSIDGVFAFDGKAVRELLTHFGLSNQGTGNLDREIIEKFLNRLFVNTEMKITTLRQLLISLEEKNVQIFVNAPEVQALISDMGFSGEVITDTKAFFEKECRLNCFSDWLGIVEADLGESYDSQVKRGAELTIRFEEGVIKRKLTILIKNEAQEGRVYKSYIRVIAPSKAGFSFVEMVSPRGKKEILPEVSKVGNYKEAGIYFEVGGGEIAYLTFAWEGENNLSFSSSGEYRLYWRKQAGIDSEPIRLEAVEPNNVHFRSDPPFNLTGNNTLGYNTKLLKDNWFRIYW